jgi:hypothetical protein
MTSYIFQRGVHVMAGKDPVIAPFSPVTNEALCYCNWFGQFWKSHANMAPIVSEASST